MNLIILTKNVLILAQGPARNIRNVTRKKINAINIHTNHVQVLVQSQAQVKILLVRNLLLVLLQKRNILRNILRKIPRKIPKKTPRKIINIGSVIVQAIHQILNMNHHHATQTLHIGQAHHHVAHPILNVINHVVILPAYS